MPKKDFIRIQLGRRLPKDGAIHMRLQDLLVTDYECWRRDLVHEHSLVDMASIPTEIRMLRMLNVNHKRLRRSKEAARQA